MGGWVFPVLGAFFLIFRLWLCEVKTFPQLEFRSRYISRILTYYFAIAMMLDFTSEVLNLIIAMSLPMMAAIFFIFDLNFIVRFSSKTPPMQLPNIKWLVIERATLHPPLIITGLIWWIIGLKKVFNPPPSWFSFVLLIILFFGPYLFIDVRWTKKYEWREGLIMLVVAIVSILGMMLYFFLPSPPPEPVPPITT